MRKYFYILITLLAVLSIGFVGCKNKPTAVSDFIDEANEATTGTDFNPIGEIKGYGGYNFSDYAGNFFGLLKNIIFKVVLVINLDIVLRLKNQTIIQQLQN